MDDDQARLVPWGTRLDPDLIVRLNVHVKKHRLKVYRFIDELLRAKLDVEEAKERAKVTSKPKNSPARVRRLTPIKRTPP
jgi:hypothetical protein